MKKVALVLFLMTFVLVSCSFPKLVKVEDNPTRPRQPRLFFLSQQTMWLSHQHLSKKQKFLLLRGRFC